MHGGRNSWYSVPMDKHFFEVNGLLRLRDESQHKTVDRVEAQSPVEAVRLVGQRRRGENGKQFKDWLYIRNKVLASK